MKQETFFGVRKDSEKHLYVRRGDNNEVLITKTVNGGSVTEENTVHLNAEETRKLGIQLLKLGNEELPKDSGEEPGFSIEGEELEKLISALAKIV